MAYAKQRPRLLGTAEHGCLGIDLGNIAQPARPRSTASQTTTSWPASSRRHSQPWRPSGVDSHCAPVMPPPCHSSTGRAARTRQPVLHGVHLAYGIAAIHVQRPLAAIAHHFPVLDRQIPHRALRTANEMALHLPEANFRHNRASLACRHARHARLGAVPIAAALCRISTALHPPYPCTNSTSNCCRTCRPWPTPAASTGRRARLAAASTTLAAGKTLLASAHAGHPGADPAAPHAR